jgi:hypothetical protein
MLSVLHRLKEAEVSMEDYQADCDDDIKQLLDEDYEVDEYNATKLNVPLVLHTPEVLLPSIAQDKMKEDNKQYGSIRDEIDGIKRLIHYIEEFYTLSSEQLKQTEEAHYNAVCVFKYVLNTDGYSYKEYTSIYGKSDKVLSTVLEEKSIADHCIYYHQYVKDNEREKKYSFSVEKFERYEQLVKTRKEQGLLTYESIANSKNY